MLNKFIAITALLFTQITLIDNAQAKYVGPTNNSGGTISDILKNPLDDQRVILNGFIIKKIGHEKYLFKDETGEIRIDIDDEKMPAVRIDHTSKVQIHGDVDVENHRSPQIDVDAIIIK